jgi:hypothetical protein
VVPLLPPQARKYIETGRRYWSLVGSLLDDFAVLLFTLCVVVLWGEWRSSTLS